MGAGDGNGPSLKSPLQNEREKSNQSSFFFSTAQTYCNNYWYLYIPTYRSLVFFSFLPSFRPDC